MTERSISCSRDIQAPIGRIFSVLTRPVDHPQVDGSGMLRSVPEEVTISKVGDVFAMNMFNDQMGDYVMENHVVEFESERLIAWEPQIRSTDNSERQSDIGVSAHYRWGWQLDPLDAGQTRVTEFFDCSRSPEWLQEATANGDGWRTAIEASLENLDKLVAET